MLMATLPVCAFEVTEVALKTTQVRIANGLRRTFLNDLGLILTSRNADMSEFYIK